MSSQIVALVPGALFQERYRVVSAIKVGGMGAVYQVVDERTNAPRALKIMLPEVVSDPDLRARFALEARITGNIASDHIVGVSDAGIDAATQMPFLVMELLRGVDIGDVVEERGPLPATEVVLYLTQAALALDKTHAAGIVHRDLKPENLFLTRRDDGSPCVKILDFGIAKMVAKTVSSSTQVVGTPTYMAPEQVRGDGTIGPPADLFSLAHIAYALLVGEPYWREETKTTANVFMLLGRVMAGMQEKASARALRRTGVGLPLAFDDWLARATAAAPEARFQRATEQVAALAEALGVASATGGFVAPPMSSARSSPSAMLGATPPPPGPVSGVTPSHASISLPSGPTAHGPDSSTISATAASPRELVQPPRRSPAALVIGAAVAIGVAAAATVAVISRSPPKAPEAATTAVASPPPQATTPPVVTSAPTVVAQAPSTAAPTATAEASASAAPHAPPPAKIAPRRPSKPDEPAAPRITTPI